MLAAVTETEGFARCNVMVHKSMVKGALALTVKWGQLRHSGKVAPRQLPPLTDAVKLPPYP